MTERKTLAILVGGGPAPGINSVIGAATIRARLEAVDVLGIRDGFEWIMQGDIDHVTPLDIGEVSRIHFRGGSYIGISRANPTQNPAHLDNAVLALLRLNVSQLITIGGDDTAYSAMKLEEKAAGRLQVVHVPKTIDNDLDLPPQVDTFGFQTARHYGVEIVKNLMVDARTTSRWYLVITMGRGAGHLAVGIGKAAGATLTLIPEEFLGRRIRLKAVVDTLVCAIIKRLSYGRLDGVAVVAEGLTLGIDPAELAGVEELERDTHGNVRIAEVNIGEILKAAVQKRLKEFGLKATIAAKNIGYELRRADGAGVGGGVPPQVGLSDGGRPAAVVDRPGGGAGPGGAGGAPPPVVQVRRLPHHDGLPLPTRQTAGSAGYDVHSAEAEFTLRPLERRLVRTGSALAIPDGYQAQVRPRSGLALKHGPTPPNAPATIDSGYRGELMIPMINLGTEPGVVTRGTRIAQLVFQRVEVVELEEVAELPPSERGGGGFGSTGV